MPKSKRAKIVKEEKTKKKGKEHKNALIEKLQECADKFSRVFVLSTKHLQVASITKELRDSWVHSRLFFGKRSLMSHALGRDRQTEYKCNLHKISLRLRGQRGLLFTNSTEDEVLKWFSEFKREIFARMGDVASETVELKQGELQMFQHTMEPTLRKLGLPTTLKAGVIQLIKDFTVCEKGKPLTSEQAHILKLLNMKTAEFSFVVECMWFDGKYKAYTVAEETSEGNEKTDDDDDDKEEAMSANEEEMSEDEDD